MEILKDVYMLESTSSSHVYLIKSEDNNILIDTGYPGLFHKIKDELNSMNVNLKSIKHILLTHHDIDHMGNAKLLQEATGALLWASDEDIPYINGKLNRPGLRRIVQIIVKHENPIKINSYSENPNFDNISIIKTPGHTPGHVAFIYKRVLFCGDLINIKNNTVKLPRRFYNYNQSELIKSIKILKTLDFQWICPAHGEPILANEQIWVNFFSRY